MPLGEKLTAGQRALRLEGRCAPGAAEGSDQGRHAISGLRGWVRIWAVLRFFEHGVVLCLLAGVCVREGVIVGEQRYTGSTFLGGAA